VGLNDEEALGFGGENWVLEVDSGADQRLLTRGGSDGDMQKTKKAKKSSYFTDEW
jgi:hypothetical protein